jgi:parallel beta-helix repeat protein
MSMKSTIIVMLILASSALAETWRVEKDGSGDYSVIQDAVSVSTSGDTILIGPGRYDDTVTFTTPFVTWTVCVSLPGTDLTIIGAGMDATYIGPAVPGEMSDDGWRGFANWPMGEGRLVVENATVENVFIGLQVYPTSLELRDCRFPGCHRGLVLEGSDSSIIERCEFVENSTGIDIRSCSGPTVRNCSFVRSTINESMTGVYMGSVSDYLVENCTFDISLLYSEASIGTISGCTLWNCYDTSIWLISGRYIVEDNEIDGTQHARCIKLEAGAEVLGSGNILRNASMSAVSITNSYASFSGNHIFSNADFVTANGFSSPPLVELDFRNNYWGTSDPLELAERIKDGYDNPAVHAYVLYEPFSGVPMSNEERSWGEIKALYKQ